MTSNRSHPSADDANAQMIRKGGVPCSEHDAPETLLLALQALIVSIATSEPSAFDRPRYEALMALWEALAAEMPTGP